MNRSLMLAVLALTGVIFLGCKEKTLEVEPYLVPCMGVGLQSCFFTWEPATQEWMYQYSDIKGFQYQWGHRYQIRIRLHDVANPLQDASSIELSLVEILSDQPVAAGTAFSITLDDKSYFEAVQKTGDQYILLGERTFTCTPTVCQMLDEALKGTSKVVLELHHPDRPDAPLTLDQVH